MSRLSAAVTCLALAPLLGGLAACSSDNTTPADRTPPIAATSTATSTVARQAGAEFVKGLGMTIGWPTASAGLLTSLVLCGDGSCSPAQLDLSGAVINPGQLGPVRQQSVGSTLVRADLGPPEPVQAIYEFTDQQRIRFYFRAQNDDTTVAMNVDTVQADGQVMGSCYPLPGGAPPPSRGDFGYYTLATARTITACGHEFQVSQSTSSDQFMQEAALTLVR